MKHAAIAVAALLVSACGSTNNYLATKTKTVEYYRIFDIKTSASRAVVAKAASDGLGRNTGAVQEATPIPSSAELPERPGRFSLANPLEGTRLGALAGAGGTVGFRVATCDGAIWTARAQRKTLDAASLQLTACLFPYRDGYHLDLYAVFTKKEGGLMEISRQAAWAVSGTPEEWTEKTFLDTVRTIRAKTGADISYLEGQPELGATPWIDEVEKVK